MGPQRPLTVCGQPGCHELIPSGSGGRCVKHKRARWRAYEAVRPERDRAFYNSPEWRKVRAYVLAQEPLCRECKAAGRVTSATEVDHVRAVKDGGAPFDPDNLQPLCLSCDSRKTLEESRAAGKLTRGPS